MFRYKYILLSVAALALTSSCDDFLDEMPDNRTELDTPEKITKVLVSAYPDASNIKMCEFYSDNYAENAGTYGIMNLVENDFYFWQDTDQEGQDTPQYVWQSCYSAISSANHALDAIEKLGGGASLNPQKAEALICRAYSHFILATTFCKPYNTKADQYLGIPYVKEMETTVSPHYERLTLADTYEDIKNDIEAALPLINDDAYQVIKYHFNRKAAYAFASRFYLYYMQADKSNLDKVIEYADKALGSEPYSSLRDWKALGSLTPNGDVQPNAYVNSANSANLLIQKSTSWWPYVGDPGYTTCMKYSHNNTLSEETCKSIGPWGGSATFYQQPFSGNSSTKHGFRRMYQYMKMVNNQSGYGLFLSPVFTTDETLICRAEAYALKGEFAQAIEDINEWQKAYTSSNKEVTVDVINNFYGPMDYWSIDNMTVKKRISPDFTVNAGTQENIIHNILHIRRVLNLGAGLRWHDVKRYGITIQRLKFTGNKIEQTDEMTPDDERRAIQIPNSVISAGLTPNPRN